MREHFNRVAERIRLIELQGWSLCDVCDGDGFVDLEMFVDPPFWSYNRCEHCEGIGAIP